MEKGLEPPSSLRPFVPKVERGLLISLPLEPLGPFGSPCVGPGPSARSGGPPISESIIQIIMLAATVLWPRSILRFSFACFLRPHARLNPRTPLTLVFPIHTVNPKRWKRRGSSNSPSNFGRCKGGRGGGDVTAPSAGEREVVTHPPSLTGLKVQGGERGAGKISPPLLPAKVEGREVRTPSPPLEANKGGGGKVG